MSEEEKLLIRDAASSALSADNKLELLIELQRDTKAMLTKLEEKTYATYRPSDPGKVYTVPAHLLRDLMDEFVIKQDLDESEHVIRELAAKYHLDPDQLVAICKGEAEWLE